MKALREIGLRRALRFLWTRLLLAIFRAVPLPPLRSIFLRLCGARVGADTILHRFTLINVDRGGFAALQIGEKCFLGDEVLVDLAATVILQDHVTLAARAIILTHLNVGYKDHPLMARFPSCTAGVTIERGSFIGTDATILPGCRIGPEAFVAAAALVNRDVDRREVVGGVPIKTIKGGLDERRQ